MDPSDQKTYLRLLQERFEEQGYQTPSRTSPNPYISCSHWRRHWKSCKSRSHQGTSSTTQLYLYNLIHTLNDRLISGLRGRYWAESPWLVLCFCQEAVMEEPSGPARDRTWAPCTNVRLSAQQGRNSCQAETRSKQTKCAETRYWQQILLMNTVIW